MQGGLCICNLNLIPWAKDSSGSPIVPPAGNSFISLMLSVLGRFQGTGRDAFNAESARHRVTLVTSSHHPGPPLGPPWGLQGSLLMPRASACAPDAGLPSLQVQGCSSWLPQKRGLPREQPWHNVTLRYLAISLITITPREEVSGTCGPFLQALLFGFASNQPFPRVCFGKAAFLAYCGRFLSGVSRGTACSARSLNACLTLKQFGQRFEAD